VQAIQGDFYGKDILAISQFSRHDINILFAEANRLRIKLERGAIVTSLQGKIVANLFYEPSTRTASSFVAATQRLSGGVIQISDIAQSSVTKGETLSDTVRTLGQYADAIILRHTTKGQVSVAAEATPKPVINAGDGAGEHPTQALLDLYTILREYGRLEGLTVTMVGDLKYGRTVHSLARLLSMYGAKLNYVAPKDLRMPPQLMYDLAAKGLEQYETTELEAVMSQTDVLYVTRVQKERFESEKDYLTVKGSYVITPEIMKLGRKSMVLMHPLPRVDEIETTVDSDPRAVYFYQVENGMYLRAALLNLVLGRNRF
jgi:aspartate carbamoyltransferase